MNDGDFAWMCLIVITVIGTVFMALMDDAEGAGTPMWEPDEYLIDENPLGGAYSSWAARGPDNIVRRAWQDDDYALVVSYTSNNGSTWSDSEVIDSAWKGHTSIGIGGIAVLANNTTLVHFLANNADDVYNAYLACRWNWSGAWDIVKLYGNAVNVLATPKMAINETMVLLTYSMGGGTSYRYKTFDPATSTVSPAATLLPILWYSPSGAHAGTNAVTVNQSGLFIMACKFWSGSDYRFYVRDLEETHAACYANMGSSVYLTYGLSISCTSDDLFVLVLAGTYTALSKYWIPVFHQTSQWSNFSPEHVGYGLFDPFDYWSVATCIDDDNDLTIYWANDTGAGGDVHISKMTEKIDATDDEWMAAVVDRVYNYGTDDDVWSFTDWYDNKYPVVGGYSVNVPDNGWMGGHAWKDEVGTPDDYGFALYWNATFHMYDWAPAGPGPGGGGGGSDPFGEDEPWVLADPDFMGDLWTLFVVTSVFVGIATAYRKYTDRYTGWKGSYQRWSRTRPTLYKGYQRPRRTSRSYYREVRYQGWRPRFRKRNWGK